MTTLATALSNAAAVMGQTDTQYLYLSRGFVITSDAGQKATPEDLVTDLQTIFHSCKNEADRLNIAKKILITLGIIVPKQGTPESQAHFAKIKEIALQALAPERQTGEKVSRARYFQDNLIILLWAKNLMSACGVEALQAFPLPIFVQRV